MTEFEEKRLEEAKKEYYRKLKGFEKYMEEEIRQTVEDIIRIEREIEEEEKGCRRLSTFLLILFIVAGIAGWIIVHLP